MLLTNSYLQGLTDAMPSIEDFREFMAPALRGEGGRVVNLHLDSGEPGALPSTETGWLSLVLHLAGVPLARVVAPEPGRQWDWMALTERAVAECAPAVGADGLDAVESLATSHPSDPDVRMPA